MEPQQQPAGAMRGVGQGTLLAAPQRLHVRRETLCCSPTRRVPVPTQLPLPADGAFLPQAASVHGGKAA